VTNSSSNVVGKFHSGGKLLKTLAILVSATWFLLILWAIDVSKVDPFVRSTLNNEGSLAKGARLYRINCAGCHGIAAQGLLGPNLHDVSAHLSDRKLIHQVIDGRTPPMPSFQMKPQTMADLLKYLHSLD
tara:strand:+ start:152 stop:541 length:390 start_codon:yes stop_codon:yes gene_type:complete